MDFRFKNAAAWSEDQRWRDKRPNDYQLGNCCVWYWGSGSRLRRQWSRKELTRNIFRKCNYVGFTNKRISGNKGNYESWKARWMLAPFLLGARKQSILLQPNILPRSCPTRQYTCWENIIMDASIHFRKRIAECNS